MVREFQKYKNVREKSGNFENHALFSKIKIINISEIIAMADFR